MLVSSTGMWLPLSDYYQTVLNRVLLPFAMFLLENLGLLSCVRGKALKHAWGLSVLRNCIFRSSLLPCPQLQRGPTGASAGMPRAGEGMAQLDSHFCWQRERCCQPSGTANRNNFEE